MASAKQLHQLIQSLTSSEKRYFKLFSSEKENRNKRYLELYDQLEHMTSFDEYEIDNDFSSLQEGSHVLRNYLAKQLLRALRSFHDSGTPKSKVFHLLKEARILSEKGLYIWANEQLGKAKQIAIKYEYFELLHSILLDERKFLAMSDKLSIKSIEKNSLSFQKIMNSLGKLQKYQYHYDILFIHFRAKLKKFDYNINEVEQLAIDLEGEISFREKELLLKLLALHYRLQQKLELHVKYYEALYHHYQAYPEFKEENKNAYRIATYNLLSAYISIGEFANFSNVLEEANTIPSENFDEEAEKFQNQVFYGITLAINRADWSKLNTLKSTISEDVSKYKAKINSSRLLSIYHNACIGDLLQGDTASAINWNNSVLNYEKTTHRTDLQCFARIVQIILQYDSGNISVVHYLHRNAIRYIDRRDRYESWERLMLSILHKLSKCKNKKEEKEIAEKYLPKLQRFDKDLSTGKNELLLWVRSKSSNESITTIFTNSLNN